MSVEDQVSDLLQTALETIEAANTRLDLIISDNEVLVDKATELAERGAQQAIKAMTSNPTSPFIGPEAKYYERQIDPTRILPVDHGFLGDQAEYYQRATMKKARSTR